MEESAARLVEKKLDALCREEKERCLDEEIQSVKLQLGLLTAILGVAGENPDPCRQLQAWVNKVRQVLYDAEDALDEYFWVCFRKRRGGLHTKILYSVKDMMRSLARVAARIQSLKSRVTECTQSYPYAYPSFVPSGPIREDTRWLALWIPEKDPVGMDKPKDDLVRLLHLHDGGSASGLKVVSIVGMGGLGKTTLAAKVFQDVKTNFEVCARIKVSQTYNFMELLQQIVRGVYQGMNQPTPQQVQSMRDGDVNLLVEFVLNLLRPKTYLILLDDVWSINDWNTLQMVLPDNQCCGSRILLTTRNRGVAVASTMTGKGEFYELSPLSSEDSWSLFCKKTFRGSPCPSRLKTNCQRIVEKCGGLPLAIVAISHNWAPRLTSHVHDWEISDAYQWEMIGGSMSDGLESRRGFQGPWEVLSLSYNDLPYYLKNCFLYLAAFPKDFLIKRMTLIRLWVAEGFVLESQNLTSEEVAESYLNQLLGRNLIQVGEISEDGRLVTVRMHNMFRNIAIKNSKNQEFLHLVSGETTSTAWARGIRRLSMEGNRIHEMLQQDKSLSKLRTLLVFGEKDSRSLISSSHSFPST